MNKVLEKDMNYMCNKFKYKEEIKGKTILITGATGLIAKNFLIFLSFLNKKFDLNIKIIALVRNEKKAHNEFKDFECDNLKYIVQDICEPIK